MPYKTPSAEPIAIVGSSCRFCGDVNSPSQLWNLLQNPRDLSKLVPPERFNIHAFFHENGEYHGATNSPKAYWLEQDHRVFDAAFFNIAPKEAAAIDPQQRLMLEVVYEALEGAGYTLEQYSGEKVAVFAGLMTADYTTVCQRDDLTASQYASTGNAASILSNRISYFFNFHGPSMTIDTACSSSLVALHQAILSLRAGESVMACVTGANMMLAPEQFVAESKLHMLSPSGHCRMWDADADGYARGEGIAAIFIKPLSRALADGDQIEAIIRETGVNSDGHTAGITMPSPEAQSTLICDTYRRSGLDPHSPLDRCQYFEAHGTGTQAGDPCEAAAIQRAFFHQEEVIKANEAAFSADTHINEREEQKEPQMLVGSVKTVIGHTEGSAGLAGLLKTVQSMRHGLIPPNLHHDRLNPAIAPFYTHLGIPKWLTPWPKVAPGEPRRASVNSFGFGGTNSHAIVEQYVPAIHDSVAKLFCDQLSLPLKLPVLSVDEEHQIELPLLLSANTQESLVENVRVVRDYIAANEHISMAKLAWTYARRTAHAVRLSVTSRSRESVLRQLDSILEHAQSPRASVGIQSHKIDGKPKILGIFTGQGAQWATMSKGLLMTSMIYRESIRALDSILASSSHPPSWTLEQEIMADRESSRVHTAEICQPLCTAIQIGLVDLLRSIGIEFHTVVGHSSGEIAAAYAAGRLSARDAILIAYYRGTYAHLARGTSGVKGGMLVTGLSRDVAERLCTQNAFCGKVTMAASNAPSSVTLSGDIDVITTIRDKLAMASSVDELFEADMTGNKLPTGQLMDEIKPVSNNDNLTASPNNEGHVNLSNGSDRPTAPKSDELLADQKEDDPLIDVNMVEFLTDPNDGEFLAGPDGNKLPALKDEALPAAGNDSKSHTMGIFARMLQVDHAYHSHHMEAPAREYLQSLESAMIVPMSPKVKTSWVSSVYGSGTPDDSELKALYWKENMLKPVLFFEALQCALEEFGPFDYAVEVGPHPSLGRPAQETVKVVNKTPKGSLLYSCPLNRFEDDRTSFSRFLGWIWSHNMASSPVQLRNFVKNSSQPDMTETIIYDVPGHTWKHDELYYRLSRISRQHHFRRDPTHELLGDRTRDDTDFELRWRNILAPKYVTWLNGHKFQGQVLLPASAYCIMAVEAAGVVVDDRPAALIELEDLRFLSGVVFPENTEGVEILSSLALSPDYEREKSQIEATFTVGSAESEGATPIKKNFTCRIRITLGEPSARALPPRPLTRAETRSVEPGSFYKTMREIELNYTGPFEAIQAMGRRHNFAWSTLAKYHPKDTTKLSISPATLDSCFQGLFAAFAFPGDDALWTSFLPVTIDRIRFNPAICQVNPTDESLIHADSYITRVVPGSNGFQARITGDVLVYNQRGDMDIQVEGITAASLSSGVGADKELYLTTVLNIDPEDEIICQPAVEETSEGLQPSGHLKQIVRQISHRYPRMNVLSAAGPDRGVTHAILDGLGSAFQAWHCVATADEFLEHRESMSKQQEDKLILHSDGRKAFTHLAGQAKAPAVHFDLVIISTSVEEMQEADSEVVFQKLEQLMRPGGFLILVHEPDSPTEATHVEHGDDPLPNPPHWIDALDKSGFAEAGRNGFQAFKSGGYILIRQCFSPFKDILRNPLARPETDPALCGTVLIVGGSKPALEWLLVGLRSVLEPHCDKILEAKTLEDASLADINKCNSVIFLADLDSAFLIKMTEERLKMMRSLLRHNKILLWVTRDAFNSNPAHAASFGFIRSLSAERSGVIFQMLDLDTLDNAVDPIARTLTQLNVWVKRRRTLANDVLWTREPEIYIRNGRRVVSRVLPWTEANERANSTRHIITKQTTTLEHNFQLVVSSPKAPSSPSYEAKRLEKNISDHDGAASTVQVDYSSVEPINCDGHEEYVCLGTDLQTGKTTVAMSPTNSSIITPSTSYISVIGSSVNKPVMVAMLIRYLAALEMCNCSEGSAVLMIEPDDMTRACAKVVFASSKRPVRFCTSDIGQYRGNPGMLYLHTHSSAREINALFPADGGTIFSFLPEDNAISRAMVSALPANCRYNIRSGATPPNLGSAFSVSWAWDEAVAFAIERSTTWFPTSDAMTTSLPDVLQSSKPARPFQLVDWTVDRRVSYTIKPIVESHLFSGDKTYAIIGMTGDFGQSLCTLFVEHGARNIVLASRNPNYKLAWRRDFHARGVNIAIDALDVTDFDDVMRFSGMIEKNLGMPPVAGVVNGAMVLDDKVFDMMNLDTWTRVMRPKTVGSKILDVVFSEPDMEFFIMTSSFAAIGGHAGQSNYAAANMYMNGLAADRRRRGLPGSALNIGVIYGLGLLHRENRVETYSGLERDGYPPISERDIHHMFLEAIVAGRPTKENDVYDITTGLRRYKSNQKDKLHWQVDPRFSHYTVPDGDIRPVKAGADGKKQFELREQLGWLNNVGEVVELLLPALLRHVEVLLQRPQGSLGGEESAGSVGVDSLIAVQIRAWLHTQLGTDLPVMKIMETKSLKKLCKEAATSFVVRDEREEAV